MRISDWSSDVCTSDLPVLCPREGGDPLRRRLDPRLRGRTRVRGLGWSNPVLSISWQAGKSGTVYIGVTSDLRKRVWQHREGIIEGFTKRYGCKLLVWCEAFESIHDARQFEERLKKWNRAGKIRRIEENNHEWDE